MIHGRDVAGLAGGLTGRHRSRTVELAASPLRENFRFLRPEALREDRLEDPVPMMPNRPTGLGRHLDPGRYGQLIAWLDSSSPRGLRDRAIALSMVRLGCGSARSWSRDWRIWTGATPVMRVHPQDRARRATAAG